MNESQAARSMQRDDDARERTAVLPHSYTIMTDREDATASQANGQATPPLLSPRSVLSSASSSESEPESKPAPEGYVVRNGKLYSKKKANMPYLNYAARREREARRRATAKESSPPYERTEQVSAAIPVPRSLQARSYYFLQVSRSILRYTVVLVLGTLLLSRMMTASWTFGYTGRLTNLRNWVPRPVSPV